MDAGGRFGKGRSGWGCSLAVRVGGAAPELGARVLPLTGGAERHELPAKRALREILIGPISRISPISFSSLRDPCGGELLGVAAALDEIPLQGDELLVQQVVRLVDQAKQSVRHHCGVLVLQPSGIMRPAGKIT